MPGSSAPSPRHRRKLRPLPVVRRPPQASVNFVTCHDGFTLRDLVSYDAKHNDANGEGNRDGSNDNLSWNCGVEGSHDDAAVEDAAAAPGFRKLRVLLLVSQGVPMVLAGDEVGRSQHATTTPGTRRTSLSWLDWQRTPQAQELRRFWRLLIGFRKRHPTLRRRAFFDGSRNGARRARHRVARLPTGRPGLARSHDACPRLHTRRLRRRRRPARHPQHGRAGLDFELPVVEGRRWHRAFDTALASPTTASEAWQGSPSCLSRGSTGRLPAAPSCSCRLLVEAAPFAAVPGASRRARPAGLVRRAQPGAGLAVKVSWNGIRSRRSRIVGELPVGREHRAATRLVQREDRDETSREVVGGSSSGTRTPSRSGSRPRRPRIGPERPRSRGS